MKLIIQELIALSFDKFDDLECRKLANPDIGMLNIQAKLNTLCLSNREAEVHPGAEGVCRKAGYVLRIKAGFPIEQVITAADAILGVVRIKIIYRSRSLEITPAQLRPKAVTATKHIVLLVITAKNQS